MVSIGLKIYKCNKCGREIKTITRGDTTEFVEVASRGQ